MHPTIEAVTDRGNWLDPRTQNLRPVKTIIFTKITDSICYEGDPATQLFLVHKGASVLLRRDFSNKKVFAGFLKAPFFVGEEVCLYDPTYRQIVIPLSRLEFSQVPDQIVHTRLKTTPNLDWVVKQAILHQEKTRLKSLEQFHGLDLRGKVAQALLISTGIEGFTYNYQTISLLAGNSGETAVAKVLQDFQNMGLVHIIRGTPYQILGEEALQRLSDLTKPREN